MSKKIVFERQVCGDDEIAFNSLVSEIASRLKSTVNLKGAKGISFFCVWLNGSVGTGKTHLTRAILYALGLQKKIPVLSPTFAYATEYKIDDAVYLHMDLYRGLKDRGEEVEQIASMGGWSGKLRGVFIEWPGEMLQSELAQPTALIEIDFIEGQANDRLYRFYECVE